MLIIYETIPATGHHSLGGMPSSAQLQGAGLIPPLSTGDTTTAGVDERSTGQEGSSINQQAPGVGTGRLCQHNFEHNRYGSEQKKVNVS